MQEVKGSIDEEYAARFSGSQAWAERARELIPSGVTHDSRYFPPFAPYIERAEGARKWDVDGNVLIDYWMGHGALILGHAHPRIVEAVQAQVARGTHYGGSHSLEVRWAESIRRLMPAAERVRFVNSGTEATQLAMRLARAFTGRTKIIKFSGHFHGWHDYASKAVVVPFDVPATTGVPAGALEGTLAAPANDLDAVRRMLEDEGDDVAGIIVEPGGGGWGALPIDRDFIVGLGPLAERFGALLIFDEVVTGFRLAPGGAQEYFGIRPDLICLAKIVAGGLPGGAVAGRADVMDHLGFRDDDPEWNRYRKIGHQGTFNANPLTCAAGVAALTLITEEDVIGRVNRRCEKLVTGLNEVLVEHDVEGWAYGEGSMFHVALDYPRDAATGRPVAAGVQYAHLAKLSKDASIHRLRKAMLLGGIDLMRTGGFLSVAHGDEEVAYTVRAFDGALRMLKAEGSVGPRSPQGSASGGRTSGGSAEG